MASKSLLDAGLSIIFNESSQQILIKKYSQTINSGSYDDEVAYTDSGSEYVSGLVFPIKNKMGSAEALLLEQGKLTTKDKALFIGGSHAFSGNVIFGLGSPSPSEFYTLIPDGVHTYNVNGSIVYSKIWMRLSIAGSLF